jgi:hypothetical protein
MKIQVPSSHTITYVFPQIYFRKHYMFLLTSAIIRCMPPQVETQVIKVKYTTELNSNLKRTAIEHSCSFSAIKLVLYKV